MKLVSINVGMPRRVEHAGRAFDTGIFKTPRAGRVRVGRTNLEGDGQADLSVHGGPDKAVYAYPREHYDAWARELGRAELPFGFFGENLTVEGLLEEGVCIGDVLRIGEVEVEVSQPRSPCYKLAMRAGVEDFVRRFSESLRTGFYLRVRREGMLGAGDAIGLVARGRGALSVRDAYWLRYRGGRDAALLRLGAEHEALTPSWRAAFAAALAEIPGG